MTRCVNVIIGNGNNVKWTTCQVGLDFEMNDMFTLLGFHRDLILQRGAQGCISQSALSYRRHSSANTVSNTLSSPSSRCSQM